jgi:hypothetical protein
MSVPGIMNPFNKSPHLLSGATDSRNITNGLQGKRLLSLADRRPHPSSLPPPVPLARKRGWQPSSPEPSPAATVTTSTTGHLNVHPASCNSAISPEGLEEDQGSEMAPDLPPAKRRRTLAGTIFSGAVNAALIGTAVGLTAYRLWRDRGKVPELEPPPYEQGDWVPSKPEDTTLSTTPPAPLPLNKKSRSAPNTMRRGTPRHRRVRIQAKMPVSPPRLSRHPSPQRHAKFGSDSNLQIDQADGLEDRMDWMGGRLARLIEDGKKALGKEIVVMSEAQEDEEDDGNGNWEEEADPDASICGPSRSGSVRRRGRLHAPGTPPPTASPRRQQFSTAHLSHSCSAIPIPARAAQDHLADSTRLCSSFREDESDWQSPELRMNMERARASHFRDRQ